MLHNIKYSTKEAAYTVKKRTIINFVKVRLQLTFERRELYQLFIVFCSLSLFLIYRGATGAALSWTWKFLLTKSIEDGLGRILANYNLAKKFILPYKSFRNAPVVEVCMNTENNFTIFSNQCRSVPDTETWSEIRALDQFEPTTMTSQSSFVVCQSKQKPNSQSI